MAFRLPKFRYQIGDPTTSLDSYICTMESGAMALDAHTGGKYQVWGGQLIPYCGRSYYDIVRRGTNLYNVKKAWEHWGQTFTVKNGNVWANLRSDLALGKWVILQGDYDQFSLATRCQDRFLGNHAIILGPKRDAYGRILTGDPLCKTFRYVSESELRRYAEDLGRQTWTAAGVRWTGQILYGVTKSVFTGTAVPSIRYTVSVHPTPPAKSKAFFVYSVSGDIITGRVEAHTGGFTADAIGDYRKWWPSQRRYIVLVKLTEGSRKGQYVSKTIATKV